MAYDSAINKGWDELKPLDINKIHNIRFFSDEYSIDIRERRIMSLSCNVAAKDYVSILILHYLEKKIKGLPPLSGQWITFKEMVGGESYYPAFYKRAIEPIKRKYGRDPKALFSVIDRLPSKKAQQADAAVVVEAFEGVPVLIEVWAGDEEFGAEANLLFDSNINRILCTEDVAVLGGFIARYA